MRRHAVLVRTHAGCGRFAAARHSAPVTLMDAKFPHFAHSAHASRVRALGARLAMVALLLAPVGCGGDDDDDPTGPGEAVTLTSGTPVAVSGSENSERLYQITVPSGATQIVAQTSGGTGDLDLYMRAGQPPTPQAVHCASDNFTNDESCTLGNPQAGTWYILLYGFQAYSGATLTVTVTSGSAAVGP